MDNQLITEMTQALTSGQLDNTPSSIPTVPEPGSIQPNAVNPQESQNLGYDPNLKIKYRASNRDLEEPLSVIIQRAQRGYDYAQLVNEHKQRETSLTQKEQQLKDLESKWKPYDEFANTNPEWADHVRNAWENRFGFQSTNSQLSPSANQQSSALPPEIAKELNDLKSFRDEFMREKALKQEAEEQKALHSEIEKVKSSYADIDFGYSDPATGKTLEMQVLEHGINKGINNFEAAFRDYYHQQLIDRAVMKSKEQLVKDQQQRTKTGFVTEGQANMMQSSQPQSGSGSLRNRSYADLIGQGWKDLGVQ
jgi:hypothetical protein